MIDRLLGLGGLAVVLGAAGWAVGDGPTAAVGTLVVIGLVLVAADATVWAASGRVARVPDVALPEGVRPTGPRWGLLLVPAGLSGLVAAVLAAAPVAGVVSGVALVAGRAGTLRRRSALPTDAATALRLRRFARAHGAGHGESVDGYLTPVGVSGTRLLVVAPDGAWADAMVPSDQATAVAEMARVHLHDPTDPTAARRLRIGRANWAQMARSW